MLEAAEVPMLLPLRTCSLARVWAQVGEREAQSLGGIGGHELAATAALTSTTGLLESMDLGN